MSPHQSAYLLPESITLLNVNAVLSATLLALGEGRDTLDFSAVQTLDSTALALVLACRRVLEAQGKTLRCANIPANLNALSKLYGVEQFLVTEVS